MVCHINEAQGRFQISLNHGKILFYPMSENLASFFVVQYSPEVPNPQTSEWITKHVISIPQFNYFQCELIYLTRQYSTVASERRLT